MEKLREIDSRHYFGELAMDFFQLGVGAEIGVFEGEFTEFILLTWKGKILCVDRWDGQDGYPSRGQKATEERLKDKPAVLMKGLSVDVAKEVADNSLDWVYIDASHLYEDVKADYNAWYPKVRKGGLISGHDYGDNGYGVKKFVDELGIPFLITSKDIHPQTKVQYQTWYFVK